MDQYNSKWWSLNVSLNLKKYVCSVLPHKNVKDLSWFVPNTNKIIFGDVVLFLEGKLAKQRQLVEKPLFEIYKKKIRNEDNWLTLSSNSNIVNGNNHWGILNQFLCEQLFTSHWYCFTKLSKNYMYMIIQTTEWIKRI